MHTHLDSCHRHKDNSPVAEKRPPIVLQHFVSRVAHPLCRSHPQPHLQSILNLFPSPFLDLVCFEIDNPPNSPDFFPLISQLCTPKPLGSLSPCRTQHCMILLSLSCSPPPPLPLVAEWLALYTVRGSRRRGVSQCPSLSLASTPPHSFLPSSGSPTSLNHEAVATHANLQNCMQIPLPNSACFLTDYQRLPPRAPGGLQHN
jgi:hypothetical protein